MFNATFRKEVNVQKILSKFNTLRPRQNGHHCPDNIFNCIFVNENVSISIKILLKFVPKGPINNTPALVQIMTWHWPGDKPLSEPMMVSLLMHICITRPQWVNTSFRKVVKVTRSWVISMSSDFFIPSSLNQLNPLRPSDIYMSR